MAERAWPMKVAMAPLAVLAMVGGRVGIPGVTDTLEHFLEPTFEDSRYVDDQPERGRRVGRAWRWAASSRVVGIALAFVVYVRRRGLSLRAARPLLPPCTTSSSHKWYFDELFDRADRAARRHRRRVRAAA